MNIEECLHQLMQRPIHQTEEAFKHGQNCIRDYIASQEAVYTKPVIAVAGTNGKGSCVASLTEIYLRAGYQVGAYLSPHLNQVNERFLLNGEPIDDHSLTQTMQVIIENPALESLSYFEVLTLTAWQLWLNIDPDVMILEVGLGGRLDAVNALPITAGIITSIGLDHMDRLGKDREAIALEKAGIAHSGLPLVVAEPDMPTEAIAYIDQQGSLMYQNGFAYEAHVVDQELIWSCDGHVLHLPRPKLHHQSVGAALMMVTTLNEQLPVDESCFEFALTHATLPGRFECINDHKQIWVDVAHNLPAIEYLLSRWPYSWHESCCIIALKKDKDWRSMLKAILKQTKHIYVVDMKDEGVVPAHEMIKYMKLDESYIVAEDDLASFLNVITEKTLIFGCFTLVNLALEISENRLAWDEPNGSGEDDA